MRVNKDSKKILNIFARYLIILFAGLGNLYIFYKILTPLTVKTLAFFLSINQKTAVIENFIEITSLTIEIVPACVAGAAFYLLFILVFSVPNLKPKKRLKILGIAFASIFILNILRILFLISIANESYFSTVHWVFWHLISTVFVVGIWYKIIKIYKIKDIPIYSDVKYLKGLIKPIKKSKRQKKN